MVISDNDVTITGPGGLVNEALPLLKGSGAQSAGQQAGNCVKRTSVVAMLVSATLLIEFL